MKTWHPYLKDTQDKNHEPLKDGPKVIFGVMLGSAVLAAFLIHQPSSHAADPAGLELKPEREAVVSEPQVPVYSGPYCQRDDHSLVATLEAPQASSLDCAANGLDAVHRFVKPSDFSRDQILEDYKQKISAEFKIPEEMKKRVGFWFDVYTKYPSYKKILHHARYPWVKYGEFDLTPFLVQPRVHWMNVQAADKYVTQEKKRVVAVLEKLARRKTFETLSADEQKLYDLLAEIPGSRSHVFRDAALTVRFQLGQMDFFVEALLRKSQYIEIMEQIFNEAKLPTELLRLPLVESSFNPHAVSKAGAMGVWQFMPATARSIMKVNPWIDERRSPIKATLGAARYLRSTHRELYRSWPLTILAYNHGPSGVRKAARHAGSNDISTIIARYESRSFAFASKNYYAEFLAALYAERYQSEVYGQIQQLAKIKFERVTLTKAIKPKLLAERLGLNLDILSGYNLDIRASLQKNHPLPAGYTLHVPPGYSLEVTGLIQPAPATFAASLEDVQ